MENSIVVFTFSVLEWKYPFWGKLLRKIEIFISSWNFVLRLIWICTMQEWSSLFCFRQEILFSGKFCLKIWNCCFKPKFHSWANLNMQNSKVMFMFSVVDWIYPFWGNLVQKIKFVISSWNFVLRLIWIWRIQ